jgi:hypothetical protein
MSFRLRSLALGLLVLTAAPAVAAPVPQAGAKYDPPTAVGQLLSGQRLLDEIKGFAQSIDPRLGDEFDKGIADALGEKGFAGVDLKKPVGLFAYIKPKLEHSYLAFAVPVTSEKEALDLLDRLQFAVEEEKGQKGLYRLRKRGFIEEEVPVRVKFHDGHAYLAVNADADELDVAKLIPIKALVDDKEKAPLAATVYVSRVPKELIDMAGGLLAEGRRGMAQLEQQAPKDMPQGFPAFGKECLDWAERNWAAMIADGETLTFRLNAEHKSGAFDTSLSLTPKAGSKLATDVAAIKKGSGRFHQLTTKDAVGGAWISPPALPKGIGEKGGKFLSDWINLAANAAGEPAQPVLEELARQVDGVLAKGQIDSGLAVFGPDKDSLYTGVLAIGLSDAAALEKVVKDTVKGLPKEVQGLVKLDAEKAGDLSVHVVTLPEVPQEVQKLIGQKAEIRVAFGAGAAFVAAGPGGLEQIKRAAGLKAAEAKGFDVQVNAAKVKKMTAHLIPDEGARVFDMTLGQEDKLRSLYGVDITGGKELTISWSQYQLGLFFGFFGARAVR